MTKSDHLLIVMMFARMRESFLVLAESFTSRGIWSDDDAKAFAHAVHADERKVEWCLTETRRDYLFLAKELGVATGLE
jgi:hypothetical protein